jgi:cellulose 1,4-beta-cellobiosidase
MKKFLCRSLMAALCVTAGGSAKAGIEVKGNPYAGASFFVNPYYVGLLKEAREKNPELASQFNKMMEHGGTGVWIVTRALVPIAQTMLDDARKQQEETGKPVVSTFVVYNLPERDCAASASAGELLLDQDGLEKYKHEFIDPLVAVSVVLEPDSLPNLVTNNGVRRCNDRVFQAYREGVVYALRKLALNNVTTYLDVGHSGWLGWDNNRRSMAKIFKEVLTEAGGTHLIRGFATNVSNYSPLVEPDKSIQNQSGPYFNWNPAMDELTYVSLLRRDFEAEGISNRDFIIDTGRNGNPRSRTVWGNWCNIQNARLGAAPTVKPAEGIDAYVWIKPPGESDGSAVVESSMQPRDPSCASVDSMPNAPLAGEWFHDHALQLLK